LETLMQVFGLLGLIGLVGGVVGLIFGAPLSAVGFALFFGVIGLIGWVMISLTQ